MYMYLFYFLNSAIFFFNAYSLNSVLKLNAQEYLKLVSVFRSDTYMLEWNTFVSFIKVYSRFLILREYRFFYLISII